MKTMREDAAAAVKWWRRLQPYLMNGARNPTGDRAALARLRRADLFAAMEEPETLVLFHTLGRRSPDHLPSVALCAAVLSGVRAEPGKRLPREHPARSLGPASLDAVEAALMKPLRFRRLIEAESEEDRLIALRRAVQLADRRLNPFELAAACLDWSDERRRRWIFEYYNAGAAAPGGKAEPEPEDDAA